LAYICNDIARKEFEFAFNELPESFFVLNVGKVVIEAADSTNQTLGFTLQNAFYAVP
jgi:hypothetical protein